ncbi:MAG: bacteriohemerythrin [Thermodesulfovibrionales bacterium]|nr:bacteriohemerythrin [Thermodesulfovibrionales bacterium]
MSLIQWNDDLLVGIKEVDEQHKGLVEIINNLYDAMKGDENKDFIKEIISKLKDYTIFHFDNEEKLMQRHKYPAFAEHSGKHKDFCTKVFAIERDLHSGKVNLSMEILNFLSNWLITHIHGTDKKFGEFFKKMS